ncbi:carbonic anhydrase [Tothia fuscella]|uniref:Carbonic anhydrase n=1 Tax=Tothia fuscella TaxID=1048955 RepID=A0A9P4TXI7_9PEZI|nr:carbonic anhydrase [Tothia fuscella]
MSAQFQRSRVHPGLIPSLGGTKPQVLWIGCSCSSPSDMRALELDPKDFIAHRNIGNIVSNTDLSTQSSLEYALQILKVKHIVVCGHYNCMFVSSEPNDDVPEKWLRFVVVASLVSRTKVLLSNQMLDNSNL